MAASVVPIGYSTCISHHGRPVAVAIHAHLAAEASSVTSGERSQALDHSGTLSDSSPIFLTNSCKVFRRSPFLVWNGAFQSDS
jgi:hypothetical protein